MSHLSLCCCIVLFSVPAAPAMQARLENALLAFPTVPGSFKWEVGVTPLSDPRWVVFAPLLYVLSVVGAKELLGERTLRLGPLPALHNLVLALGSAAMFAGTGLEAWRAWRLAGSAEWLFCLPAGSVAVGPLFWWSYVYYLSKARAACLPASLPGTRLTLPFPPPSSTSCWTPSCASPRASR